MVYHPHVHFVVPGGGVSNDGTTWLSTPTNFLFAEAAAFRIYRQKMREALRAVGLEKNVDPSVWHRFWSVDVEPVHDGRAVLKYLAPYVFCRRDFARCGNMAGWPPIRGRHSIA